MRAETEGMTKEWLPQIEIHFLGKKQTLILLMILCYVFKQEPSIIVLWEVPPSNQWKEMHRLPTKIKWSLESLVEELGEGLRDLQTAGTS